MKIGPKHVEAARLLVEGELSLAAIAERVGVARRLLESPRDGWRATPEFQAVVREIGEAHLWEARAKVRRWAGVVVARLFKQLDSPKPNIQLAAARELREWMGLGGSVLRVKAEAGVSAGADGPERPGTFQDAIRARVGAAIDQGLLGPATGLPGPPGAIEDGGADGNGEERESP